MTGTEITYDEDGYALTPQGQAWKLWVSGEEPATQADHDWFEENRGIPWTDSPDQYPAGPYRSGPWRTWPLPAAHRDPAAHPEAEPEAEA
jgi:hypothetical protein